MTPCRCAACQADRLAHRLLGFVAGLLVAYLLWGVVATIAASRSAQPTEVRVDVSAPSSSAGQSGTSRSTVVSSLDPSPVPVASDAAGAVQHAERTPSPSARPSPASTANPRLASSRLGVGSWYDDGPGEYAALPGYRAGTVVWIIVCGFEAGRSTCLTLPVVTSCQCYVGTRRERIVDLSPASFAQLAPLSRGLVRVTVERLP